MPLDDARPIAALPPSTTSYLRSALVISSLPSVLVELVQNSLDANASSIHVSFDLERWTIKCEDNGTGIELADLYQLGGERYLTSKLGVGGLAEVETFGFRGEALSSLADVGMLELLTRPRKGPGTGGLEGATYSLVLRDGKRVHAGIAKQERTGYGTTVWVRDIYYRFPVRRRPLSTPSAQLSLVASFRTALTTIALLHPQVTFTLDDTASAAVPSRRLVNVSRSKEGILGRWRQLWGRAGVEKVVEFEQWEDDSRSFGAMGFISLTAAHSKAQQFVYVNHRPLSSSPLHKLVNVLFATSSFARHANSHLVLQDNDSPTSRKSPRKANEQHPIFVLNLRAPPGMIDVTLEPEKRVIEFEDTERVHRFVELVVRTFLQDQGFLSKTTVPSPSKSPSKRAKTQAIPPRTPTPILRPPSVAQPPHAAVKTPPLVAFPRVDVDSNRSPDDAPMSWTDPSTRQSFLVDARTGNSWRPSGKVDECHDCEKGERLPSQRRLLVDRSGLRQDAPSGEEEEVPEWMVQTLKDWNNPVFAIPHTQVSALQPVPNDPPRISLQPRSSHRTSAQLTLTETSAMSNFFHTPSDTISSLPSDVQGLGQSFSKEALRNGQFIAQVDRKFLLVRLDASSRTETLVMIDQHAADERCRVERFLDQTCGNVARGEPIEVCTFTPPIAVVVSVEEAREMKERTEQYSTWGIGLDWSDRDVKEEGGQDYAQVYVTTVPLLVSDRLRVEPALLQALLRSYLAQLLERPRKDDSRRSTSDSWSSTMRDCPPVLLELINSKACRGAIMFNDELSSQQCTTLVARLAETNFPFQCAHGRPSLVPIVNLARAPTKTVMPARGIDWTRLES